MLRMSDSDNNMQIKKKIQIKQNIYKLCRLRRTNADQSYQANLINYYI